MTTLNFSFKSRWLLLPLMLLTLSVGNVWGATVTLPFEWTVNNGRDNLPTGVSHSGLGTDYAASNAPYRLKFDTQGDYILINIDSSADVVYFNVKMLGGTSTSKFKVQGCATSNGTYSDIQEFTISGSSNTTVVNCTTSVSITSSYRYIKIIKSQHGSNVGLGYVKITKAAAASPATVTLYDANGSTNVSNKYVGNSYSLPTTAATCAGKTFVGWSTSEITTATNTKPSSFKNKGESVTLVATNSFYAVYATITSNNSSVEVFTKYSGALTTGDYVFIYNSYVMGNTISSNRVANGTMPTITNDVIQGTPNSNIVWTIGTSVSNNTTYYTLKNGTKYLSKTNDNNQAQLVNSVNDGARYSCNSNANSTTYDFVNLGNSRYLRNNGSNGWAMYSSSTGGALTLYKKVSVNTTVYDTTAYTTSCCTPLGQINGSVSFTNVSPTSVTVGVPSDYSDKDNANLEGYIFKRYAASTGGDALETIETDAANKTTATFNTGLVANTTYYYTIIAKHSSSSCNSAETSPRKSYKIDSYVVSYANGGGSGANPGAHNPVLANGNVELKTNTFDAPTGKGFVNWSDGSNSYDEGEEYTVTANTTMTAQWECLEPGFTKNLSSTQVKYLQGETAAKLSVTAAVNGAELSYAWEMSANGTTGWSSVGTNSNEYKPSTATAGDQYYHCIVTNLAEGCTESKATSAVAHIHVDVPAACLEPVISVASGTYYEDKSVTITCGTEGAAIYYTTDGGAPGSGSTLYTGAITVDHSMTIKAIAIKAEMENSTIVEATYTIKCETPTIVLAAGNYTGVQTTTITKGYGTKIYYTTDGSTPSNTNGTEYTGAVSIDQPMTLKAIVWKDGCTNSEVASAAYTLKCTTPTFNNGTGTYTGAQSITLSGTAGADIYYTLDGTTPSKTNGTKYTAAISVSTNQTVKAIAVKEGWGDSEIASATYTIQYNVYWWVNGADWNDKGGSTLVTYGQTATAPTTTPTKADGCGDKFMGWTETQNYENDNTAPVDMFTETSAAITKETNFYAVFADYGEE